MSKTKSKFPFILNKFSLEDPNKVGDYLSDNLHISKYENVKVSYEIWKDATVHLEFVILDESTNTTFKLLSDDLKSKNTWRWL